MVKKIDYAKTKIYKLISNNTDRFYIGSTAQPYLSCRLSAHVKDAKIEKKITSTEIINAGDYKIILIENYPCNSIEEQKHREQYYLDMYKDDENLVNRYRTYRTPEFKIQQMRTNTQRYYKENKEEINQKQKTKIECSNCGCMIVRNSIARHKKTEKCINYKNNI